MMEVSLATATLAFQRIRALVQQLFTDYEDAMFSCGGVGVAPRLHRKLMRAGSCVSCELQPSLLGLTRAANIQTVDTSGLVLVAPHLKASGTSLFPGKDANLLLIHAGVP